MKRRSNGSGAPRESDVPDDGVRTDGAGSDDEVEQSYVEYRCTACGKGHPRNMPPCDRCGNMELEAVTVRESDADDYLPEGSGLPTRELLAAVSIVGLVLAALALGGLPFGDDWTASVDSATVEEEVVATVGAERSAVGVPSLSTDERLAAAAAAHNRDMISEGYFGPVSPDGEDVGDWLDREDASCSAPRESFTRLGEDPPGSGPVEERTAGLVVARLLDDQDGRATLLWADATRIGVDVRPDDEGRLYASVVTCGPAGM